MVRIMQLHHTDGKPDWARIRPEARNYWQRFAVTTKSIGTPGNVVSAAGLATVVYGMDLLLRGETTTGMWLVVAGRFCDVVDGFVADHTGTKSPLGGAVDATFDKLGALGILLATGISHIVPWWAVVLIALQNGANSGIAYAGWRRKRGLQPVLAGKVSTALQWGSLSGFLLAAAYTPVWLWPAYGMLVPALITGVIATIAYARMLK